MGVPAFYRWLTDKYPKIIVNSVEEKPSATGEVDATAPNPNELEFHNLYLDMNGCIHPCFHPDDDDPHAKLPTTFDDVFKSVFLYIDRIFAIVRPRKLLYLAIDGVAPRAKMNQQRSRRFQTAKTKQITEEEEERLRQKYEKQGKKVLPQVPTMVDDSNVITPGTEFMFQLSKALQGYIKTRISDNPAWRDVKVILSDSNVPGEGEHKIMSFIRSQRTQPGYDPNTRHCLYGLDADLIMLALATHELHFSILREEVLTVKEEQCLGISSSISSFQNRQLLDDVSLSNSRGSSKPFDPAHHEKGGSNTLSPAGKTCRYQFLHVWILREYLELDLKLSDVPDGFKYDFERVIDDFVFMCFFVGNDFLPHMPTFEIHECAIDLLMAVYKQEFKNLGGYLVDTQRVNERHAAYIKLKRVEKFILAVANFENMIFDKRNRMKERSMRRIISELSDSLKDANVSDDEEETTACVRSIPLPADKITTELQHSDIIQNTRELKDELKRILKERSDTFRHGSLGGDKVKFGSTGWKERYYRNKFNADNQQELESSRKSVAKEYTEGLCWVLLYYFSGVPSWTWFYPYHYGPCASDLRGLSHVKVNFQMGSPFTPFDQLMAVLPPRSAHALPRAYRDLMTDPCSKLLSFYPKEFIVDVDGKRYLWQGVCLLPFIDEKILLSETKEVVATKLQGYELERNVVKVDKVFLGASSKFASEIQSRFSEQHSNNAESRETSRCIEVNYLSVADGIAGYVWLEDDEEADTMVLCVNYELPNKQREIVHRPLAGVKYPVQSVFEYDIDERLLWHEHNSHRPVSRVARQNRCMNNVESGDSMLQDNIRRPAAACGGWRGRGRGESMQNNIRPVGRGWRGRGVSPSYPAGQSSTRRMSDSIPHVPQTYIAPHLNGGSARPVVVPFQRGQGGYIPSRQHAGRHVGSHFRGETWGNSGPRRPVAPFQRGQGSNMRFLQPVYAPSSQHAGNEGIRFCGNTSGNSRASGGGSSNGYVFKDDFGEVGESRQYGRSIHSNNRGRGRDRYTYGLNRS